MLKIIFILFCIVCGSLINYWPIENGNYNDVVSGYNLSSASPNMVKDRFGTSNAAFKVTGASGYFVLPPGVYFWQNFSVSIWTISYDTTLLWSRVLDCGNGGAAQNVFIAYSSGTSTQPAAGLHSNGDYCYSSFITSNIVWYHYVMTVNGLSVKLYLNGVQVASSSLASLTPTVVRSVCYLGHSNWPNDVSPYADFDDVKIFNQTLTSAEVLNEYNNATSLFLSQSNTDFYNYLTNYWPINGSTVDVVAGADLDSYSPTLVADRFGNQNSSFRVTSSTNFFWAPPGNYFSSNEFSVIAWVKPYSFDNWGRVFDFSNGQALDNFLLAYTDGTSCKASLSFIASHVTFSSTLTSNTWYHLAATVNGTSGKLYVNGVESTTSGDPLPITKVKRWINYFGKSAWSSDPPANADYDDIKFFSKTLTQQEVIYDYLTNSTPYTAKNISRPTSPYNNPSFYLTMTNYWPITDQNYSDYVSGYDLQPTYTPVFVPDRYGTPDSAFRTNSSQFFSAPPGVYFGSTFTAIGWVNTYNPTDGNTRLIDFGNGPGNSSVLISISNNPYFCMNKPNKSSALSSPCNIRSSSVTVPSIKWLHFALSVSPTESKFYMNGVLIASALSSSTPKILRTQAYIGRSEWAADANLNGEIDQLKIFNTALSADQILYDFDHETSEFLSRTSSSFYASLSHYWPINGSVIDVVGGKNLTGSPYYVQDRYGVPSSAFRVTSASNCLQAPTDVYFNQQFTVTLWFYVHSNGGSHKRIFDFGNGQFNGNVLITYTGYNGELKPYMYTTFENMDGMHSFSPYAITIGYWNHLALSIDSTTASFYINGIIVLTWTLDSPVQFANRSSNYFGYSNWPSDGYSDISLDEIKFFNIALTHQQVVYDYLTNSTPYIALSDKFNFDDLDINDILTLLRLGYDVTNCLANCSNHGSCYKKSSSLLCLCNSNYTGDTCNTNLDPCSSYPCLNNGTCVSNMTNINATSFYCDCQSSYFGEYCQKQEDLCANVTCSGHGSCQINITETYCNCYYLYSGRNCETKSSKKQIIDTVVTMSSVIAIAIIVSFYAAMVLMDLDNLYRQCTYKPKQKKRVYRLRYTP